MRKIAIITGASSGIGGATAVALAERGVDSIVTFNSHEDRVRDVVEAVRQKGAKAVPLRLDVGESAGFIGFRDEVTAVMDSEWKAHSFDYLVNNAGFLQMALFEDTTEVLFWSLHARAVQGAGQARLRGGVSKRLTHQHRQPVPALAQAIQQCHPGDIDKAYRRGPCRGRS